MHNRKKKIWQRWENIVVKRISYFTPESNQFDITIHVKIVGIQTNISIPCTSRCDWQPRMMHASIARCISLLLMLQLAKVKAYICVDHTNGCSTPFQMQCLNKDLFTPSCNNNAYLECLTRTGPKRLHVL